MGEETRRLIAAVCSESVEKAMQNRQKRGPVDVKNCWKATRKGRKFWLLPLTENLRQWYQRSCWKAMVPSLFD